MGFQSKHLPMAFASSPQKETKNSTLFRSVLSFSREVMSTGKPLYPSFSRKKFNLAFLLFHEYSVYPEVIHPFSRF